MLPVNPRPFWRSASKLRLLKKPFDHEVTHIDVTPPAVGSRLPGLSRDPAQRIVGLAKET